MRSARRVPKRPKPIAESETIIRDFVRHLAKMPAARKPARTENETHKPRTEKS